MTMNLFFNQLYEAAKNAQKVLITGPKFPDGDSIGACLALAFAIERISSAEVEIFGELSFRYRWLPKADAFLKNQLVSENYDLAVVLDGDRHRLPPEIHSPYHSAQIKAVIDHHASTDTDGYDICIVSPDSASTCELLLPLLLSWKINLNSLLATWLYTGIIFDTGGFRHSNTTSDTHLLAANLLSHKINHNQITTKILMERQKSGIELLSYALSQVEYLSDSKIAYCTIPFEQIALVGGQDGDFEGIVENMLYVQGVELSCLLLERNPLLTKVSLRSRGLYNVALLAQDLSSKGGGHTRAAGAIVETSLSQCEAQIRQKVINHVQNLISSDVT